MNHIDFFFLFLEIVSSSKPYESIASSSSPPRPLNHHLAGVRKRKKLNDAYHRPDETEVERMRQRRIEQRRAHGFIDDNEDVAGPFDSNNALRRSVSGEEIVQRILLNVERAVEQPHQFNLRQLQESSAAVVQDSRRELSLLTRDVQAVSAAIRSSCAAVAPVDTTRTLNFRLPDTTLMPVRVRCSDKFDSIVTRIAQHVGISEPERLSVLVDHIALPSTSVTVESLRLENDDVVVLKPPIAIRSQEADGGCHYDASKVVDDGSEDNADDDAEDGSSSAVIVDDGADSALQSNSNRPSNSKPAEASVKRVAIRVKNRKGDERVYNLPVGDPFSKLFAAYCDDAEIPYATKFEFDGELVDANSTPAQLDMEDDDLLTFIA